MRKLYFFLAVQVLLVLPQEKVGAQQADAGSRLVQPAQKAAQAGRRVTAGADGLHFSTRGGADTLHVHGYVQADDRMFWSNVHGESLDAFLFRRIRPLFEGTVWGRVDYRFMPDFGQNKPQIQEAYADGRILPGLRLRVGKLKEPIGLEVLQQDRQLLFPERSMASDLVPLRYMGAQLGGVVLGRRLEYEAGYFNGSQDGSNGNFQWVQANELVARVFAHPFGSAALRGLGVGVAGSDGREHGAIAALKTVGQSTFFSNVSGVVANGEHSRVAPEANFYSGRWGVESEYVVSSEDVRKGASLGTERNAAWQVGGSVLLTGEKNSYDGAIPRSSFRPERGWRHLGAFEIALRGSQVRIGGAAFPVFANAAKSAERGTEYGVGMNWMLNRYVKLTTAYERTGFGMSGAGVAAMPAEKLLVSQAQLAF